MSRNFRMLLLALFGPSIGTVVFIGSVFGFLHLIGVHYSLDQIKAGALFFLLCWQVIAFVWLYKNWD